MAKAGKGATLQRLQSAARAGRTVLAVRLLAHGLYAGQDQIMMSLGQEDGQTPGQLAGRLGVTAATVNGTVARLQRAGLVHSEPYRSIFLTETGRDLAEGCRRRHRIVLAFLRALGVSEATAETDAEGIEHHVSDETLEALERVTREGLAAPRRRG